MMKSTVFYLLAAICILCSCSVSKKNNGQTKAELYNEVKIVMYNSEGKEISNELYKKIDDISWNGKKEVNSQLYKIDAIPNYVFNELSAIQFYTSDCEYFTLAKQLNFPPRKEGVWINTKEVDYPYWIIYFYQNSDLKKQVHMIHESRTDECLPKSKQKKQIKIYERFQEKVKNSWVEVF